MSLSGAPGETVQRTKGRARVVVTYEIEIPESELMKVPQYKRRPTNFLRDMNLIHYVGSDKTGHWEVKHGKIHMHQL